MNNPYRQAAPLKPEKIPLADGWVFPECPNCKTVLHTILLKTCRVGHGCNEIASRLAREHAHAHYYCECGNKFWTSFADRQTIEQKRNDD